MSTTFKEGQAVEFFQTEEHRKEGGFPTVPNGHPLTVAKVNYKDGRLNTVIVRFDEAADGFFKRGKEFPINPTFLRPRATSAAPKL